MPQSIIGNPGSDPQGASPSASPGGGGRPAGRSGVLRIEHGHAFVEVDGERILLDNPNVLAALARGASGAAPARRVRSIPKNLQAAVEAVKRHRAALVAIPGVVAVRAGYKFDASGRITNTPAIVVAVDRRFERSRLPDIPFEVDVAPADPYDLLAAARSSGRAEAAFLPAAPRPDLLIESLQRMDDESLEMERVITYRPPPGASLPEVTAPMTITCHVSPDAGWKVLRPFLTATREQFVLGMYDFTAPHIYDAVRGLLRDSDVSWTMTLGPNESLPTEDDVDSTKADDKSEDTIVRGLRRVASSRFQNAFAHVGAGRTFASAYHIKVGVRDRSAFWLSSGNWQSSNQPDVDFLADDTDRQQIVRYNREWHVVIENEKLAKIFETYLQGDFDTASQADELGEAEAAVVLPDLLVAESDLAAEERGASPSLQVFAPKKFTFGAANPLRVQPILTPDNYIRVVRDLLRNRPSKTLYFQNQSLNPVLKPTDEFEELMQMLVDFSNDAQLDVRMIFRNIGPVRKKLESLQAAGFNMSRIRMQAGCHTKGIIVDSKKVLLGSHNFTNDGAQFNRDASLLIHDEGIASYYQDVFLHDWERLARPTLKNELAPVLASGAESSQRGYVRVPWSFYDELD